VAVLVVAVALGLPAPAADAAAPQRRSCVLDSIAWSDPQRVALPGALREVSGLALLDGARLLAHDDERGVVSLLDSRSGARAGQFSLGPRLPRDDFEGIAVLGARLFLSTSGGRLYEATVGRDGETVSYRVFDTGLGRLCELEGLAADPATRTLLLACKSPRTSGLRGQVTVFTWSVDRAGLEAIRFRAPEIALRTDRKGSFRPSALEVLPGGDLLILSGADRAIAVVTPPGIVRCTRPLDAGHRQAEGLARLSDGSLAVADEGNPARLTVYPRRTR
jgi:hypothetical protein